jgi:hypothetical protein
MKEIVLKVLFLGFSQAVQWIMNRGLELNNTKRVGIFQ